MPSSVPVALPSSAAGLPPLAAPGLFTIAAHTATVTGAKPRRCHPCYLAGTPCESGNDRCQFVRVDGLGQVGLKASQQRQLRVVFLDKRG
jgi:hypothetical protein